MKCGFCKQGTCVPGTITEIHNVLSSSTACITTAYSEKGSPGAMLPTFMKNRLIPIHCGRGSKITVVQTRNHENQINVLDLIGNVFSCGFQRKLRKKPANVT